MLIATKEWGKKDYEYAAVRCPMAAGCWLQDSKWYELSSLSFLGLRLSSLYLPILVDRISEFNSYQAPHHNHLPVQ